MERSWYPTPPIPEADLNAAVDAVERAVKDGAIWPVPRGQCVRSALQEAAEALGIPIGTMKNRLQSAGARLERWPMGINPGWKERRTLTYSERIERQKARAGLMGFKPVLPGYEVASTTTRFDKFGEVISETVRQKQAAETEFELPEGRKVGKVTAQIGPDGRVEREWVRHSPEDNAVAVIEAAKAAFEAYRGWAKLPPPPEHSLDELVTIYPVADFHLRMLAWGREAGEDYDIPIAVDLIQQTFAQVIHQCPRSKNAMLVTLGDILHADSNENKTARSGHVLDVDTRHHKGLEAAVFLLRSMVEMLLQHHHTVTVRHLPGNHDPESTAALNIGMLAFFHGNDRVIVDNDPSPYWFARFGSNLFGAHHGHLSKPNEWAGIMASHRPQDWGETTFRHFFGGHLHHKQKGGEGSGMTWEIMQSPAAKDAYNAGRGYWAGRSLAARVYHKDFGFMTGPEVNILPKVHRARVIGNAA